MVVISKAYCAVVIILYFCFVCTVLSFSIEPSGSEDAVSEPLYDFSDLSFDSPGLSNDDKEEELGLFEDIYGDSSVSDIEGEEAVSDGDEEIDPSEEGGNRRRLSNTIDFASQETTSTYDGKIPETTCPKGYYRPSGSTNLRRVTGQRSDGCLPCPRGRYGASTGLHASTCTAPCPVGRYGPKLAATSLKDCEYCPIGRYGMSSGMTKARCSAACPAGRYGSTVGLVQSSDCKACSPGMMTGQCQWAVQPRFSIDIDHQHDEIFGLKPNFKDPLPQTVSN